MAGGDAAKLEKEKQKNLANEQDQSPHKDAPRWNEALAVSLAELPTVHSMLHGKASSSGMLDGSAAEKRNILCLRDFEHSSPFLTSSYSTLSQT